MGPRLWWSAMFSVFVANFLLCNKSVICGIYCLYSCRYNDILPLCITKLSDEVQTFVRSRKCWKQSWHADNCNYINKLHSFFFLLQRDKIVFLVPGPSRTPGGQRTARRSWTNGTLYCLFLLCPLRPRVSRLPWRLDLWVVAYFPWDNKASETRKHAWKLLPARTREEKGSKRGLLVCIVFSFCCSCFRCCLLCFVLIFTNLLYFDQLVVTQT